MGNHGHKRDVSESICLKLWLSWGSGNPSLGKRSVCPRFPLPVSPKENDSGRDNRECPVLLACWPDGDFNVLAQSREKFHQAANGKITGAVSHQQRHLGLLHAEDFGDLDLCHAAVLEDGIDLQRKLRLEQLLLRIGKAKVSKDIPAAFGHAGNPAACLFGFALHFSSAFLENHARHLQAVV